MTPTGAPHSAGHNVRGMHARPLSPGAVARLVSERVLDRPADVCVRVAVDGAPATRPEQLAGEVAQLLRTAGRPVAVVPAEGFLRPASLRFEHGRSDPDAYYEDWLDVSALAREVLDPLEPDGRGIFLPSLWDRDRDRATRVAPVTAAPGQVVLVPGTLLLGRWLGFDLTVHLALSPAALRRRTPAGERWMLPAHERYALEAAPEESADLVVRWDDARHPALVLR